MPCTGKRERNWLGEYYALCGVHYHAIAAGQQRLATEVLVWGELALRVRSRALKTCPDVLATYLVTPSNWYVPIVI